MQAVAGKISELWQRVSRTGLRPDERSIDNRRIVLLNRVVAIMPFVFLLYIPAELILNGTDAIHYSLLEIIVLSVPLILNRYRLFTVSIYYLLYLGGISIVGLGVAVGDGPENYVTLMPTFVLGIILLNSTIERVVYMLYISGLYVLQRYLFTVVDPVVDIPEATKEAMAPVFYLMSILLIFILSYYFLALNKRFEEIITEQKETLSEKNEEIMDSINYAKRIQSAMLPAKSKLRTWFKDGFILYKPKDIVAGDFYWGHQSDNCTYIAAADCTGHGVPGALVSFVCINVLKTIIKEHGEISPGEILDIARANVEDELSSNKELSDGMDISLLKYTPSSGQVEWAGANNSLLIYRESSQEQLGTVDSDKVKTEAFENNLQCFELKGDKQPVGKHPNPVKFTTHKFSIKANDKMYLFSDGYVDQFGGERGKKFKLKQLKNLLANICSSPMEDQYAQIDTEIEKWRGDLEQVDDICMIGISF